MTAPGADSTNGTACAVVLPGPGRHERDDRVFPARVHLRPGAPPRPQQLPEHQPGLGRARPARGSAPASDRRSPVAARATGSRVSSRIRGLLASAATGSPGTRPMTARSSARPPRSRPRPRRASSTTATARTAAVGVCGQASAGAAVREVGNEFHAERLAPAAREHRGQPGRHPDQAADAASPQQPTSTTHPPAVPPGASDGPGPSARLTSAPAPGWSWRD